MLRQELLSCRPLAKKKKTMSEFWKNLSNGIMNKTGSALSGGLSSAVSGLVNGAIGAIFRPSLRQQINSQKELMQEQARINKEQYDYQYDKTSPETMVQLYRNAGLNPGLMYSGNAGSGVRASMGSSSFGSLLPFNGQVPTDPTMSSTIANIEADTDLKSSAADLNDEKTKTEKLEQINKEIEQAQRRLDLAKTEDERSRIRAEIKVLENQAMLINSQRVTEDELREPRKRNLDTMSDLNIAHKLDSDSVRSLNVELKQLDKRLTWQSIQESISRETRNYADADLAIEKASTEYEVRDKLRAERGVLLEQKNKVLSEIANIEANTSLKKTQKQEMISNIVYNYAKSSTAVVDEVRKIIRDARDNKGKSDEQINNLVEDALYDVTISALLD